MPIAVVFFISFAALAFEVLLTRIFSITQWHHLTFMVISIALFGFAAAGTCLGILESRSGGWVEKNATPSMFVKLTVAFTLSTLIVLLVIGRLPLDYFRLPVEPHQTLYLAVIYFLPAIPFFIAGFIVTLVYARWSKRSGQIYFANMAGSALGAICPLFLLPFLDEVRLTLLVVGISLIALLFYYQRQDGGRTAKSDGNADGSKKHNRWGRISTRNFGRLFISIEILLIAGVLFSQTSFFFPIRSSSYKDLAQIQQYPHTRILQTVNGIRGRIDTVESPYLRHVPGLSLKWTEPVSARMALFKDSDGRMILYEPALENARRWAPHTLAWAGYLLADSPQRILLLIQNGGTSISCAAAADPADLTIVVAHPVMASLMGDYYQLPVKTGAPAGYLARSKKKFDLIQVENWGASLSGTAALTQDYTFTTDQFRRYLTHLTEDGVLVMTRRLKLPPADMIRLWATAFAALKKEGMAQPSHHIAILRNWDIFTLIVSIRPLTTTDSLRTFALNRNFDPVFLPRMELADANRFNRFERPYYYSEIDRLAQAFSNTASKGYFDTYLLDAAPQSDLRPFPNRFIKWTRLKDIYKTTGSRFYAFFLSGEIMVVAVLIQAILISVSLLFLPVLFGRNVLRLRFSQGGFFLAVGVGFILSEMYFIKTYTQIFDDPLISFAVVLSGLLIFSGIGGFYSQRLSTKRLTPFLVGLVILLLALYLFHDSWTQQLLQFSFPARCLVAGLLLLPTGFLLGLAFPIGMRDLLDNPIQRAGAWAMNGCASVVSAIAAVLIALTVGIPVIVLIAAIAYGAAQIFLIITKNRFPA